MPTDNYVALPGAIANGSLSTQQFYAVKQTTGVDFEIGICTAATDFPIGLLQNNPNTSGHAAEVAISGVAKGQVDGTIGRGQALGCAADSRLTSVTAGASTLSIVAHSLQAGTSGQVIFVWLPGTANLAST